MVSAVTGTYTQTSTSNGIQYNSGLMNSNPVLKFKHQPSIQPNDYLLLYVPLKTNSYG